jgi:NADPH:quinone reductase-like Zn-dependent oxidoreductase
MALTGGRGVDVVMEHVGGEVFTESLKCLARGAIIVTVGAHAGEVVEFDIIPFFRKELRLAGSKNASVLELRKVMGLVADGKLKPIIHEALPLAQAAEAHRVVDSREFFGKVVLVPRCGRASISSAPAAASRASARIAWTTRSIPKSARS